MSDLVGRQHELKVLHDALRASVRRVVLVEGPAGVGKTALVEHAVGSAGVAVLRAAGDEYETDLPFGLIGQLAGDRIDVSDTSREALSVGAALLSVLAELQPPRGPLVLVIEDAHWADHQSLVALTFALRRLALDPVVAIVTARDDDPGFVPSGLRKVADEIHLTGLSAPPQVQELAARIGHPDLSLEACRRLLDHTLGNPLQLEALLRELERETIERDLDTPLPAPRSYEAMVVRTVSLMSAETRDLLAAASVLGVRWSLAEAAAMAGDHDPSARLDEASTAGLARERSPGSAEFAHPLVRSAIYHDLSPVQRRALHRAAASVLAGDRGLDHAVAAADRDDRDLATAASARAWEASRRGDFARAAHWFRAVARTSPDASRRLEAGWWSVVMMSGVDQRGAAALAATIDGGDDVPSARLARGLLAMHNGDMLTAERLLHQVIEAAGGTKGPQVALASVHLALHAFSTANGPATVEWATKALDLEPSSEVGDVLTVLLLGYSVCGRAEEGLEIADARIRSGSVSGLLGRGVLHMLTDDLVAAHRDLTEAVRWFREHGPAQSWVVALVQLAEACYRIGRWDEAELHAQLAVSAALDADLVTLLAPAYAAAASVAAARGRVADADAAIAASQRAATDAALASNFGPVTLAEARVLDARSEVAGLVEVLSHLRPFVGLVSAIDDPGLMPWRHLYALGLVSLGRLDQAQLEVEALEATAADRRRPAALAYAARARGQLEAARKNPEAADRAFEAAVEALEGVRLPFELAVVRLAWGASLRRAGRRRDAAAQLEHALRTLSELGAVPFVERCESELAACGLRPERRSHGPAVNLTPAERSVALLVAQGLSNKQVAERLVLSVRTVEQHLRRIYAKVGVSSRTQLVRRMADIA